MTEDDIIDSEDFFKIIEKQKEPTRPCLEAFYKKLKENCDNPTRIEGVEEITRNNPYETKEAQP